MSAVKEIEAVTARPSNNDSVNENPDAKSIAVFFSKSISPSAIYLRTSEMQEEFLVLDNGMQKYYRSIFQEIRQPLKAMEVEVGFPCAVNVQQNWRRGKVTALLSQQECLVNLVDFQLCHVFHIKDIYPLKDEFKECHLMLKCSLHGIFPKFGVWSDNVRNL